MTARKKAKRKPRNGITFVLAPDMRAHLEQMADRLHDEIMRAVTKAFAPRKSRAKAKRVRR